MQKIAKKPPNLFQEAPKYTHFSENYIFWFKPFKSLFLKILSRQKVRTNLVIFFLSWFDFCADTVVKIWQKGIHFLWHRDLKKVLKLLQNWIPIWQGWPCVLFKRTRVLLKERVLFSKERVFFSKERSFFWKEHAFFFFILCTRLCLLLMWPVYRTVFLPLKRNPAHMYSMTARYPS